MRSISLITLILMLNPLKSLAAVITANMQTPLVSQQELIRDLVLIETHASLPAGTLRLNSLNQSDDSKVSISCSKDSFLIDVSAPAGEKAATMYKGIKELGFLFPHPRVQISPTLLEMKKICGKTFVWRPALTFRGSHLHTLHPNEWVHGFFMDKPKVAEELIRWLARNGQNLLDMNIMRRPDFEQVASQLKPLYQLAQSLEIYTGVSLGLAFTQQKSYKLLSLWQAFTGLGAEQSIIDGMNKIFKSIPLSFIVLEAGTSEFTPTGYDRTLKWLNLAASEAQRNNIQLMTKVHCSTNQVHKKFGNYNYLPQYANADVGILPHTVMFYGLLDSKAPIYGNKDFSELKKFILQQKDKRATWYYPETSYWVAMDMDLPLLLTDYLKTRTQDLKWLYQQGLEGNLNFSTGHSVGYWLFDWNNALMVDLDYDFDPLTSLKLLGEDISIWEKHINYQHEWFKQKGLIAIISSANLQDELSETERIHDRFTMKQLRSNREQTKKEMALLVEALNAWPETAGIKNQELQSLLEVTRLRLLHSLALRKALRHGNLKKMYLEKAKTFRRLAQERIEVISKLATNYPELPLFSEHQNPTSYQFGYVFPAASAYFWKREERQIGSDSYSPWNGNMYDVWNIIF